MATIEEAIREQVAPLMKELLNQNPRLLTRLGIDRKWRRYCNSGGLKTLPPTDAILAALILLGREIVVEGLSLGVADDSRYLILALKQSRDSRESASRVPVQMSLLAGLDFSSGTEATFERAEKKGPGRVELHFSVRPSANAG
jgi:hypothetical protein